MALAEINRLGREQVINQWGFRILPPDDFDSFKETVRRLKPATSEDKPHTLGSCNFLVPFPIGRVSVGITRNNGDAVFLALISPSWLKGEQILSFIRQKSDLKTKLGQEGRLTIIEGNITVEARSIAKGNSRDVFPPYGEQIILQTEKIPIGDGWRLLEGLRSFSISTGKFVDSVFAMTGKPCPLGKAIALGFSPSATSSGK